MRVILDFELPSDGTEHKRFIAANELVAHLTVYDDKRFDYSIHACWTMRDALEYPLPSSGQEQHATTLCHLPAAMKLVEIVGHKICHWCYVSNDGLQEEGRYRVVSMAFAESGIYYGGRDSLS